MSKWERAQTLEPNHWLERKEQISSPQYRMKIRQRSSELQRLLGRHIDCSSADSRVLEIGGGATQLIDFFTSKHRYALDPLADMYQREFSEVLNPEVAWKKAKAESTGYDDNFFDIVIARNVLDHVDSLDKVLLEIRRVVKEGGVVYIGINVFSGPLYLYRLLNKDKEHPYTFSHGKIEKILKKEFKLLEVVKDPPEQLMHFKELESQMPLKRIVRDLFIALNCYHFSEFVLSK